jgi:3-oxoacyl-[acyl-carrier-protein] synthase II
MTGSTRPREHVAITGIAVTCALGAGAEEVWKAVRDGRSGIRLTRRIDVSTLSCRFSGEVEELPVPRRRPRGLLDRATSLALAAGEEALASAGLDGTGQPPLSGYDPYRAGVALGTSVGGLDRGERFHWELLAGGVDATRRHHLLTYPLYTSADALSVAHGLQGPKVVISNACAAGANSIGWAADAIRLGRADLMLAGGVDVLDVLSLAGFDSLKALDPQPCAPLSRSTGLNLGEGVALLVLESRSAAAARGATVLGWLLGYGLTSDAHHATAPDPQGSGARRSMGRALEQAGLTPADVDYLNAHGTGTPANDGSEPRAVDALFGADAPPMSSTKSQVGHMLGAAGAIEAVISTLALRDGVLPPTVNVDPGLELTRDIVPNLGREQPVEVVVSNSFAFGGNNCSLVIGARPSAAPPRAARRVVLTGAGVVSPLATGRTELLAAVAAGRSAVGPATATDVSLSRTGLAAEVTGDAHRRFVDRAYARRLDQLGVLVLSACRMALGDAGVTVGRVGAERVGMVFGTFTGPLETVAALTTTIGTQGPHKVNPRLFPNSVMNAAVGHACLSLQVKGPLSTLASGCASGLTGLGYAADLVRDGEADVMLAVSADELTPLLHLGFDRLGMLAAEPGTPYSRRAPGATIGAGGAALVVESLDHAVARGAPILAELTGYAVTGDAYRVAGNEPGGAAWAESFRRALADAGSAPSEIGAVYGDARGTPALDLAEARAVRGVWPDGVRLANLAPQTGHLHSTTALLSAVCAARTCATGWVPPVAGLTDPLDELAGLDTGGAAPGEAGTSCVVTAANWGGTYASAVLSPYRQDASC